MSPTSALPIHYGSKPVMTSSHLPPTPSTSSSINTFIEDTKGKRPFVSQPTYGSMSSNAPYLDFLDVSRPITPSQTTISPNDNDGGLYLLWTEQLLRERGYEPSSHHGDESESESDSSISSDEEEEEDDDDIEQEKDMYVELLKSTPTTTTTLSNQSPSIISTNQQEEERSIFSQLFYSCFTPCT